MNETKDDLLARITALQASLDEAEAERKSAEAAFRETTHENTALQQKLLTLETAEKHYVNALNNFRLGIVAPEDYYLNTLLSIEALSVEDLSAYIVVWQNLCTRAMMQADKIGTKITLEKSKEDIKNRLRKKGQDSIADAEKTRAENKLKTPAERAKLSITAKMLKGFYSTCQSAGFSEDRSVDYISSIAAHTPALNTLTPDAIRKAIQELAKRGAK